MMPKFSVAELMGMKTRLNNVGSAGCAPLIQVPTQPSISEMLPTHLWGPLVQKVLPDHPGQVGLVHLWGLPGLGAHLFLEVLGDQVCLERISCVQEASGPGGRQVWLWNRKTRDICEEWIEDEGQGGSSLQGRDKEQNQLGVQTRDSPCTHTSMWTTAASATVGIKNSSINEAVALVLAVAALLELVMMVAVVTVTVTVTWGN